MPKNKVSDLITDQEIAFVHLVVSGTMTDWAAAQAVGLNPETAAYIKSKPCVRAYMAEHRAAMQQQLVEQEAAGLRRLNLGREQVLARLWEIANLGPEMTRGSITGQVKALSMIVAIENLIPDRRAGSSEQKSAPPPKPPQIYASAWLRKQQGNTTGPQACPAVIQEEDEPGFAEPEPISGSTGEAPPPPGMPPSSIPSSIPNPISDSGETGSANPVISSETTLSAPPAPLFVTAPDTRVPFSIKKNPFARRR